MEDKIEEIDELFNNTIYSILENEFNSDDIETKLRGLRDSIIALIKEVKNGS